MGGAGSVLTKDEVSEKLSPNGMKEFSKYEMECRNKGLNDNEVYKLMTVKFEELVKIDCVSTSSERSSDSNSPLQTKFDDLNSQAFVDMIVDKSLGAKSPAERRKLARELTAAYVEIIREETEENIPHVELSEKHTDNIVSHLFSPHNIIQVGKSFCTIAKPCDSKSFKCETCNIIFDSAENLEIHTEHSEIHLKTVETRNNSRTKVFNESNRLSTIAKDTIEILIQYGQRHKADLANADPALKQIPKWKTAVSKVSIVLCCADICSLAQNDLFLASLQDTRSVICNKFLLTFYRILFKP